MLHQRTGWRHQLPEVATDTFVRPPDTRTGKRSPCNGRGVPVSPSSGSSEAGPRHTPTERKRPAITHKKNIYKYNLLLVSSFIIGNRSTLFLLVQ